MIASQPTTLFGEKLKDKVEERMKFYETGEAPQGNVVVMEEAMSELKSCKKKWCHYLKRGITLFPVEKKGPMIQPGTKIQK